MTGPPSVGAPLSGPALAALLPHAGRMVLLDALLDWDETRIACASRSHLDPGNPLRRAGGRLGAACGAEWGMQAMALHGALRAGGVAQRAGFVARLRDLRLHVPFLDEPGFGTLRVEAVLEHAEAGGMLYALRLLAADGAALVEGGASIALPAP